MNKNKKVLDFLNEKVKEKLKIFLIERLNVLVHHFIISKKKKDKQF